MGQRAATSFAVRQAVEYDLVELVRLQALLSEDPGEEWLDALAVVLKEQVAADAVRVLVVDGDDGLAACGIGAIEQRLPGPDTTDGRVGQILAVVTDPAHPGHGRAVLHGLLDWFRRQEVFRVDVFAAAEDELLCREAGFVRRREAALSWEPLGGAA